jgi:hypothetical protein
VSDHCRRILRLLCEMRLVVDFVAKSVSLPAVWTFMSPQLGARAVSALASA